MNQLHLVQPVKLLDVVAKVSIRKRDVHHHESIISKICSVVHTTFYDRANFFDSAELSPEAATVGMIAGFR